MIVNTRLFGDIELRENQIYTFKHGLPGFEQYQRYTVVDIEDAPFSYLQCVDNSDLAFLIIDPFLFYPDYEFDLPDKDAEELEIRSLEQVAIRSIMTVRDKIEDATINLVAPLVFNPVQRWGKQVILTNTNYQTKHPFIPVKANT